MSPTAPESDFRTLVFRDFILFAQAYGSTNATFDLDGDADL
jgi:hypothetical protein